MSGEEEHAGGRTIAAAEVDVAARGYVRLNKLQVAWNDHVR